MIKRIKWKNDPILGNLELDFLKADGKCYETIVLAGENGTGKTRVLDTLSTFLNLGSFQPFEYIEYEIKGEAFLIKPTDGSASGFHIREKNGVEKRISSNKSLGRKHIEEDIEDIRHYGCVYSKARSGFTTNAVKASTTEQLDNEKYEDDGKEDFTSIKQLLVDIQVQDNQELMDAHEDGTFSTYEEFCETTRMSRFKSAFNSFFEKLQFKHIDNTNKEEKKIVFEKHGKEIFIDDLSTGEKQVVFRGAHLLKNKNNIDDGVVLVDEPELSMHPRWQEKILNYYRKLFMKNSKLSAQMIFASHSEYVLKSALADSNDILVIILKDNAGVISSERVDSSFVLPSVTSAEVNYRAFDIVSNDFHIELYGHLQNKIAQLNNWTECSVKKCDDYIKNQPAYDVNKHQHLSSHMSTQYETLPTYVRNLIDHPKTNVFITSEELRTSIELLLQIC